MWHMEALPTPLDVKSVVDGLNASLIDIIEHLAQAHLAEAQRYA